MSGTMFRRGLLALAVFVGLAGGAVAQQAPKLQGFPTAEAAANAFTDAVRKGDQKTLAALLGPQWGEFVPATSEQRQERRKAYLAAWDESHEVKVSGDKATIMAGKAGWTLPIPLVKDGAEWRFDPVAGWREMRLRQIGHDEAAVVQTMLAIVDAQRDYAAMDPMKTGSPVYARRLLSSPGRKDGLYWEAKPGEPQSPLGPAVARAQVDGNAPDGHYGYHFRLLYGQGQAAPGGARDYIVKGRMIGGFGAIAWPVRYGVTGVMTFIVDYKGEVYQQDLGPETAQRAGMINIFNPDKGWVKADMTPP
ncbi:DUF2950 domain-containing protein [Reyranella sp.]|uniref:DUF2950 domain-containing protein n=1 Tax=Reyranella sp. TaxID=1929291 RepID=UPI00271CC105|nr:DUF2950 domain-containing protein [Reyranella sp.]MDO8975580.1 DUF2950 domain-containing protein [Reyranella sp.]